ncbi:MAG: hypothetical protein IPL50_12350 [Chitinophagaceae bacterium]|nr:hypothetical protein [Chitinophagaceae bacterium]
MQTLQKQFTAIIIIMLISFSVKAQTLEKQVNALLTTPPNTYRLSHKGKPINIHHLLNHTSGIKSYTDMESFIKHARTKHDPCRTDRCF